MSYSRYRAKSTDIRVDTYSWPVTEYSERCGAWISHPSGEVSVQHTDSEECWDNTTPNFRALQAQGKFQPINPSIIHHVKRRAKIIPISVAFQWYCSCGGSRDVGVMKDYYHIPYPDPFNVDAHASQFEGEYGFLLKHAIARGKEPLMDFLTTAAEAKETVRYISDRLRSVARLLFNFRKESKRILNRMKNKGDRRSALASAELEYRYAILPLYLDVKNFVQYLGAEAKMHSRGYKRTEGVDTVKESYQFSIGGVGGTYEARRETQIFSTISAGSILEAKLLDLNVGVNPITTAWELVPLSFVVDWFVDVSETLSVLSPSVNIQVQGLWSSLRLMTVESVEVVLIAQPPSTTCGVPVFNVTVAAPGTHTTHVQKYYKRDPRSWNDVSVLPSLAIDLSPARLLDAAALITQYYYGK